MYLWPSERRPAPGPESEPTDGGCAWTWRPSRSAAPPSPSWTRSLSESLKHTQRCEKSWFFLIFFLSYPARFPSSLANFLCFMMINTQAERSLHEQHPLRRTLSLLAVDSDLECVAPQGHRAKVQQWVCRENLSNVPWNTTMSSGRGHLHSSTPNSYSSWCLITTSCFWMKIFLSQTVCGTVCPVWRAATWTRRRPGFTRSSRDNTQFIVGKLNFWTFQRKMSPCCSLRIFVPLPCLSSDGAASEIPSMSILKTSLRMVTVVQRTNTENMKVQMGSATLYSGWEEERERGREEEESEEETCDYWEWKKRHQMVFSTVRSLEKGFGRWQERGTSCNKMQM